MVGFTKTSLNNVNKKVASLKESKAAEFNTSNKKCCRVVLGNGIWALDGSRGASVVQTWCVVSFPATYTHPHSQPTTNKQQSTRLQPQPSQRWRQPIYINFYKLNHRTSGYPNRRSGFCDLTIKAVRTRLCTKSSVNMRFILVRFKCCYCRYITRDPTVSGNTCSRYVSERTLFHQTHFQPMASLETRPRQHHHHSSAECRRGHLRHWER